MYISEFWMYNTVWKSRPLYVSQILREISFDESRKSNTAILFWILVFNF